MPAAVSRFRMLGDASCAERLEREAPLHGAGGGWREVELEGGGVGGEYHCQGAGGGAGGSGWGSKLVDVYG